MPQLGVLFIQKASYELFASTPPRQLTGVVLDVEDGYQHLIEVSGRMSQHWSVQ